ncbi:MAG: biotin/lipoyl-containing protein, partial [Candidatus Cybelea sp.]
MKPVLEGTLINVTLPEMGESVTEGSIVEWRKHVGDFVAEGDPLVEVTTDKVDVEVPATASGVVTQIAAREGETVSVGALLAQIDTSQGNGASARQANAGNGATVAKPPPPPAPAASVGKALADQPARRMARRLDVDLKLVRGSGPDGLILRSDVVEQAPQA